MSPTPDCSHDRRCATALDQRAVTLERDPNLWRTNSAGTYTTALRCPPSTNPSYSHVSSGASFRSCVATAHPNGQACPPLPTHELEPKQHSARSRENPPNSTNHTRLLPAETLDPSRRRDPNSASVLPVSANTSTRSGDGLQTWPPIDHHAVYTLTPASPRSASAASIHRASPATKPAQTRRNKPSRATCKLRGKRACPGEQYIPPPAVGS